MSVSTLMKKIKSKEQATEKMYKGAAKNSPAVIRAERLVSDMTRLRQATEDLQKQTLELLTDRDI